MDREGRSGLECVAVWFAASGVVEVSTLPTWRVPT